MVANLQEVDTLLKDYSITLTKADRASIGSASMGDKSLAFVSKAYEHAKLQNHLVPTYVDVPAWGVTMTFVSQLQTMQSLVAAIDEKLSDSKLAARYEAYQAALLFYGGLKEQSRGNVGVAKVVRSELKQKFRSKKQSLADEATTTN